MDPSTEPIKIAWEKKITARIAGDIRSGMQAVDLERLIEKTLCHPHRCYRVSDEVLVEIPSPDWGHGDVLIYLPKAGWLVRRNYSDYWHVDIGLVRQIGDGLYCWTDLWLDVTANEELSTYRVLDANELAEAVRTKAVADELLAQALESFDELMRAIRDRSFPSEQIVNAVATAYDLRRGR